MTLYETEPPTMSENPYEPLSASERRATPSTDPTLLVLILGGLVALVLLVTFTGEEGTKEHPDCLRLNELMDSSPTREIEEQWSRHCVDVIPGAQMGPSARSDSACDSGDDCRDGPRLIPLLE